MKQDPFENCQQSEEFIKTFRKFSLEMKGFMIFAGLNGTGKTFSARCILEAACRDYSLQRGNYYEFGITQRMIISQAELNFKWQEQMVQYKEANYLLQRILEQHILVLDDIGTRTPTDAFLDFLYAIVDMRYNKNAGTIITTNLTAKDMRIKFGDAFVSRVASGIILKFEGPDRRFDKKEF